MKIAVDAMGGDFAPVEIIKGAVAGAREYNVGLVLVGPEDIIKKELAKYNTSGQDIQVVHTTEYLVEGEHPAYALRTKRNASIALTVKQVREGKAQAAIGVGPTGGVVASALTFLGTVEGISRPVIGGQFLGFAPKMVTMDLGGNVDVRPDQLLDFAIVGTVYARKALGIENPKVGLLSVGKEEGKGNDQVKNAFPLLKASGLNFIGNIEGNDVALGVADVVICDGFIGNVMAKFCEGLGTTISRWLKTELKGKASEADLEKAAEKLLRLTVPADTNGGGPLWAINGVVLKAHGRSKAPEVAATIGNAKKAVEMDMVGSLKEELTRVKGRINAPYYSPESSK
jgi:glycerol-3-phosphate acyltransferase PlsX